MMTAGVRFAVVADFGRFAADDFVKVAGLVVSLGPRPFPPREKGLAAVRIRASR